MTESAFDRIDLYILDAICRGGDATLVQSIDFYERVMLTDVELKTALDRLSNANFIEPMAGGWILAPHLDTSMPKSARDRPSYRRRWLERQLGLASS